MRAMLVGVAVLLLGGALCTPVGADVVGEGVNTVRCTEGTDIDLGRKMEFMQTVLGDHFAAFEQVALFVDISYEEEDVTQGKVIAAAFQIKPDATETKLGRLTVKPRNGEGDKLKIVDAMLEAGDRIRWKVKLKGLPDLDAAVEECWELGLAVFVADEIPD